MQKVNRCRVPCFGIGMFCLAVVLVSHGAFAQVVDETNSVAVMSESFGAAALWGQGDFVARTTILMLAAMSMASWYVFFVKLFEQVKLLRQAKVADALFWSATTLEDGLMLLGSNSAFHCMAVQAIESRCKHDGALAQNIDCHTWISLSLHRNTTRMIGSLQAGMPVLATVGATAPFVGLFGTVWGIHHALIAIGVSGQASIDKVAGPVGESLVMTAIGLAVAVPAVLGYNWLVRRNRVIADSIRNFAGDLHVALLGGMVVAPSKQGAAPAMSLCSQTA